MSIRVVLAEDDAARGDALMEALGTDANMHIVRVRAEGRLADAVARHIADVVIVDMRRPDREALDTVWQVTQSKPRPIVLFIGEDDPSFMEEAIRAGVCSYNVAGLPPPEIGPIVRAAIALFRRQQQAQQQLRNAETRLEDRMMVDRAKRFLMGKCLMNEPEAYRWLRRRAMARGRRIPEIAREIVKDGVSEQPR